MSDLRVEKRRPWWLSMNLFGILLLAGAFVLSMYRVFRVHEQIFNPDEKIIRVMHWQLELGYRDALDEVIREYEQLQAAKGNRVKVLQMGVTERVYAQVLNTNLISGQAPDICGMGMSAMANNEQYLARYFVPLTPLLTQPNPYNKGTALEAVPWRETFFDGMRGLYNTRLQDYFGVPTATFNQRLFYNRQMLKEATGSDAPPATFAELLDACAKIRAWGAAQGQDIIPIAGSQYSIGFFRDRIIGAFTAGLEKELDLDLDGSVTAQETYVGFVRGKISMQTPHIRAAYECLNRLCEEFGRGFGGKDRQTAAFEFVQKRSAMIATGSWDARSLFLQAEKAGFEVGIFDMPLPAPGEPWGQYVAGRITEAGNGSSGSFGLYKFSRNFDQALDFLQFLTSKRMNQLHMEKAEWIPVVIGTEPTGRMAPFAPNPIGFITRVTPFYGGDVETKYNGVVQSYLQDGRTYEDLAQTVEDAIRNPSFGGDRAWTLEWDDMVKQTRNQERMLAAQVVRGMMLNAGDAADKHRQVLLQQIRTNNAEHHRYRFKEWRGFDLPAK